MRGERLNAALDPYADLLIVVMVLLGCAALAAAVVAFYTRRRRERRHFKVSNSKRDQATGIDLFARTPEKDQENGSQHPR